MPVPEPNHKSQELMLPCQLLVDWYSPGQPYAAANHYVPEKNIYLKRVYSNPEKHQRV